MPAKIGFYFFLLIVFLAGAREAAAQSRASAQIAATATVVVPVGFYYNSSESSEVSQSSTIIDICHPKYTGIIISIVDNKGMSRQLSFPARGQNKDSEAIGRADGQPISFERAIYSLDDYSFQDSCFITIIFSEN